MLARNRTSHACGARPRAWARSVSKTLSSVTSVSRALRLSWYSPDQKNVLPPAMCSTSSVIVPRVRSVCHEASSKSSPTGPIDADLVEERRREREVGGGAAEHPVALPGRGLDGVIGDGSDDSEAHAAAARLAVRRPRMRAIQHHASSAGRRCSSSSTCPTRCPATARCWSDVTRAGVNFADTHQRRNEYLPPGGAAAGPRQRGRRRARRHRRARRRADAGPAATPSTRRRPADRAFAIPDGVDDGAALALLLQGLTAWHLLRTSGAVARGRDASSSTPAAGGTGSLAVQLGHAARRRPRDRHRLDEREARAGARARRRRRDRRRAGGPDRAADRGQRRRSRSTSSSRRPAAQSSTRRSRRSRRSGGS